MDLWFWAALVLGGVILAPTLWFGIGADAGMYSYCSWVWKEYQELPYVGCIASDYPGIFILHRAVLELVGDRIIDFRIFDFFFQFTALGMIFFLARRTSRSSLAGFFAGTAYAVYYLDLGASMTGERDGFVLWFILAAAASGLAFERRVFVKAIVPGLLAGFAFLLKPVYGLLWPVFGIWLLASGGRRELRKTLAGLPVFGLSCLVPGLAVVLYYWNAGHLNDLYKLLVWYDLKIYAGMSFFVKLSAGAHGLQLGLPGAVIYFVWKIFADQPLALFGGLFFIFSRKTGESRDRAVYYLLPALLGVAMLGAIIQGKPLIYHRIPFWGLMMIFAGCGWAGIADFLRDQRLGAKLLYPAFCLAVVAILVSSVSADTLRFAAHFVNTDYESSARSQYRSHFATVDYLKSALKPGDQVFYFGMMSQVPFLLKQKLPTPYPFVFPFLRGKNNAPLAPCQETWKNDYVNSFLQTPPRFFVMDTMPFPHHDLPDFRTILREQFPSIQQRLDQQYHLEKTFHSFEIYEFNPGASPDR